MLRDFHMNLYRYIMRYISVSVTGNHFGMRQRKCGAVQKREQGSYCAHFTNDQTNMSYM